MRPIQRISSSQRSKDSGIKMNVGADDDPQNKYNLRNRLGQRKSSQAGSVDSLGIFSSGNGQIPLNQKLQQLFEGKFISI